MEQPAISSDLIRGHIDTIILHSLIDGDKFPQQISDYIETKSDNKYQIIQATLYSSLKRLESLGFVKSYWNDSEIGRRKFYQITVKGEELVKDNLSSWSYSRSIIDKLMDLEPSPVVKTEYVVQEVVKEVVKEVPVEVVKEIQIDNSKSNVIFENSIVKECAPKNEADDSQASENFVTYTQDETDVNFRNVLKGLIKVKESSKTIDKTVVKSEKLEPINKIDNDYNKQVGFHETIEQESQSSHKLKISGKIDFTDLVSKAEKEGYKLKVSSNESINIGKTYVNRLNLVSSIFVFILAVLELAFLTGHYGAINGLNKSIALICSGVMFIYPLINGVIWAKNRNKTAENVSGDAILISAIVAFNLFLITFAINLVSNVNFDDLATITYSLIIPILVFFNVFAYFTIRFFVSMIKGFKVK